MEPKTKIQVQTLVNQPVEKTWEFWTSPQQITQWNFASDDWCCPSSTNDLRTGGKFSARMEARDGSMGFDFSGEYIRIVPFELIEYRIGDGRIVTVKFESENNGTLITETFEAENTHPVEMQRAGWQAILNNFKKHSESF